MIALANPEDLSHYPQSENDGSQSPLPRRHRWNNPRRRTLAGFCCSVLLHVNLIALLMVLTVSITTPRQGALLVGFGERSDPEQLQVFRLETAYEAQDGGRDALFDLDSAISDEPQLEFLAPLDRLATQPTWQVASYSPSAIFGPDGYSNLPAGQVLKGIEFFGVEAAGNRFVFLIDSSISMRGPRWRAATNELRMALRQFDDEQSFYAIRFDLRAYPMFDPAHPESRMLPATPENIALVDQWLENVDHGYETDPLEAMQLAVTLEPDAIFLVSDGEFPPSTRNFLKTYNEVRDENRIVRPAVSVHAIALHGREGERMLKSIAADNGGTYRFVPDRRGSSIANRKAIEKLRQLGAELETNSDQEFKRVIYRGNDAGLIHIGRLETIEQVWLADSEVSDLGLLELRHLPLLRGLVLSNTRIGDEGLKYLADCLGLEALFLDRTRITNDGLQYLVPLVQLRALSTSGHLTDQGVAELIHLAPLETLYLVEPQVTDRGIKYLAELRSLRHLVLSHTQISDQGLVALAALHGLELLDLSATPIRGPGLRELVQLPNLRELRLRDTELDDLGLYELPVLAQLEVLDLRDTAVSDQGLSALVRFSSLQQLHVSSQSITPAGIRRLHKHLPDLQVAWD